MHFSNPPVSGGFQNPFVSIQVSFGTPKISSTSTNQFFHLHPQMPIMPKMGTIGHPMCYRL